MKPFSTHEEKPLTRFLEASGEVIILSLLFVLSSIPIITIGPSYAALYYAVNKSINHDRGIFYKTYFHGLKTNLFPGIQLSATLLVYLILVLGTYYFAVNTTAPVILKAVFFVVASLFAILWLLIAASVFPLLSHFKTNYSATIKSSFLFSLFNLKSTGKTLIAIILSVLAVYLFPFLLLALPALFCIWISRYLENDFKKYINSESLDESSRWYLEDNK